MSSAVGQIDLMNPEAATELMTWSHRLTETTGTTVVWIAHSVKRAIEGALAISNLFGSVRVTAMVD